MREEKLSLLQLQRRFKDAVVGEEKNKKTERSWLRDTPPISLSTRLKIYQYAYWARLEESLEEDFARVQDCIGKKAFLALVREYLRETPSRFASLGEVSREFPEFLSRHVSEGVSELARFEWQELLCGITEVLPSNLWEVSQLRKNEVCDLVFLLHPSISFFNSHFAVDIEGRMPEEEVIQGVFFGTNEGPRFRRLTLPQWKMLLEIQQEKTLRDLFESMHRTGVTEEESALWFGQWTEEGLLHRFRNSKRSDDV